MKPARLLISVSALALVLAALFLLTRRSDEPEQPKIPADTIAKIRDRGPAGAVRARLFELGNANHLDEAETAMVLQAARDPAPLVHAEGGKVDPVESLATRRTALVILSSCLVNQSVDAEAREQFAEMIVAALSDADAHIRHTAVACAAESGLIQQPEVRQQIAKLKDDTDPKVANLAVRLLESAPEE